MIAANNDVNDCRDKTIGSEITSSPVTGTKEHVTQSVGAAWKGKAFTTLLFTLWFWLSNKTGIYIVLADSSNGQRLVWWTGKTKNYQFSKAAGEGCGAVSVSGQSGKKLSQNRAVKWSPPNLFPVMLVFNCFPCMLHTILKTFCLPFWREIL